MTSITVDVTEAIKAIDPQELERALAVTLHEAAKEITVVLRHYPPQSHKPMKWASVKQRAWFFANLREGNITVPYRRGQPPHSQKLGASWNIKMASGPRSTTAVIGTRVSYAPYVMDEGQQAAYHRGNWKTVQVIAKEQAQAVKRLVEQSLARWARR